MKVEELDDDGGPTKHTDELTFVVTVKDGVPSRELLKKVSDGKDVTAESKEAEEKKERKNKGTLQNTLPFARKMKGQYEFELLPPDAKHPGQVHVGYRPTVDPTPELVVGDAWLDAASGEVLAASMKAAKNPTFVESVRLDVRFATESPGGRALTALDIDTRAGFAFIMKHLRVTTRFSNYRPLP